MFFRSLIGAGMIAGAMLVGTAATAAADPPNCTAADLAGVMSGVNAGTSSYLFTHPDVNAFFTGLKGKPRDEMQTDIQAYLDANPQVRDELTGRQAARGRLPGSLQRAYARRTYGLEVQQRQFRRLDEVAEFTREMPRLQHRRGVSSFDGVRSPFDRPPIRWTSFRSRSFSTNHPRASISPG